MQILEYLRNYSITTYKVELKSDFGTWKIEYMIERDVIPMRGYITESLVETVEEKLNRQFEMQKNIIRQSIEKPG